MTYKSILKSNKEKRLWIWAVVVLFAISSTLLMGGRLIDFMIDRRILEQSMFYLFLVLVFSFILSGYKISNKKIGPWIYVGVFAVYGMALLRMDLTSAERTHLFEYGLLAILINEALLERNKNGSKIRFPLLISIMAAGTIGFLDECIQYFIPYRVFDMVDVGFNYMASAFGVLLSFAVRKLHKFNLEKYIVK